MSQEELDELELGERVAMAFVWEAFIAELREIAKG